MKKLLFPLMLLLSAFVSAQNNTDKFEYTSAQPFFRWASNNIPHLANIGKVPTGNNAPVAEQFNQYLTQLGAAGWEVMSINGYSISGDKVPIFNVTWNEVSATVFLKRKIYDTKKDIEMQAAFHSKRYADTIRTEVISEINKLTWSQMGKFYKQEIVDEIMQRVEARLVAAEQKIITTLKN